MAGPSTYPVIQTNGCRKYCRVSSNRRNPPTPSCGRFQFPPGLQYKHDSRGCSPPFRIVHTVCSHDCPDSCGVLVTVNSEGRAMKVAGDPAIR